MKPTKDRKATAMLGRIINAYIMAVRAGERPAFCLVHPKRESTLFDMATPGDFRVSLDGGRLTVLGMDVITVSALVGFKGQGPYDFKLLKEIR